MLMRSFSSVHIAYICRQAERKKDVKGIWVDKMANDEALARADYSRGMLSVIRQ